eukprot:TRINITY_DN4611_c0_g1_i3.p1 TRINITY_DN4611_c0_g1~~TRINITY_DN4611_c0_g1_i3.p1  ORF type:complete len:162 (-),score=30.68 TRINITY_DN4611_c0_g1_i3:717-1202(-)
MCIRDRVSTQSTGYPHGMSHVDSPYSYPLSLKPHDHVFLEQVSVPGAGRVLELGCGDQCQAALFLAQHADLVVAVDSAPEAVGSAQARTKHLAHVSVCCADMRRLAPCELQGHCDFDHVCFFYSLHHLAPPDVTAALAMAWELLAPGGTVLVAALVGHGTG